MMMDAVQWRVADACEGITSMIRQDGEGYPAWQRDAMRTYRAFVHAATPDLAARHSGEIAEACAFAIWGRPLADVTRVLSVARLRAMLQAEAKRRAQLRAERGE